MRVEVTINRNPLGNTFYKRICFDYPAKNIKPTDEEIDSAIKGLILMRESESVLDIDELEL